MMKTIRKLLFLSLFAVLLLLLSACGSGGGNETQPPLTEPPAVTCLTHHFDGGEVMSEPTCSWEGTRAFCCTVCGEWRYEPIPTLPHTYDTEWTSDGRYHYHIAICGCYGEVSDRAEHTFDGGTVTREATCAAEGERLYTCTVCGATKTEAIPKLSHTYATRWSRDDVVHWHATTCGCGGVVADRGEHSWDEGRVTTPATCVDAGVRTYTCTVCHHTRTEPIPATGEHSFATEGAVIPPTCTAEGYTEYTCRFCPATKRDTPTDILPHDYESVTVPPTCIAEGYTEHTCAACGDHYRDGRTPTASHSYAATVIPATCTEEGYTEHVCTVCFDTYRDTPTDLLPHGYESVTVPPTCAAEGYTRHTCTACGDQYCDTPVPKLPHTYVNIVCTGCGATEYSVGLVYTPSRDGSYYSISGIGSCKDTDLVLPSVHEGLPVMAIAASAFEGNTAITSVSFRPGNKLEWIEPYAFYGCTALTSMEIPASVNYIGSYSFAGCSAMTASLPAALITVDTGAFRDCRALTSLTIPAGLSRVGQNAFSGCTGLEAVHVTDLAAFCRINFPTHESNPLAHAKALYMNGELVTRLVIPAGVTAIGDHAFRDCVSIRAVELPEGLSTVGGRAFRGCTALESITIPASVTAIGDEAFFACTALTTLTFAEGSRCTGIGKAAFSGCTALEALSLPAGIEALGSMAFGNCKRLSAITVDPGCAAYLSSGNCLIERASGTLILGCAASVIPMDGSVTAIGERAFWECDTLTSVTVPREVTSVGAFAFLGCRALTTVTFAEGSLCTSIGTRAFSDCRALIAMTVPFVGADPSGTASPYLGYFFGAAGESGNGFYVPSGLATLRLLGGTHIPDGAFLDCRSLVSLTLPAELTSIGASALSGCTGLTSLTLPAGLTSIGESALSGCSGLTTLTLPVGLTSIGESALSGCTGLTSLTLPFVGASADGTGSIHLGYLFGAAAPADNPAVIPPSLASVRVTGDRIASYAFLGCDLLREVTLAASVTAVDADAFLGCRVLILFCEAAEAPSGFVAGWRGACPVVYACGENRIADDGYHYVTVGGMRYALAPGEAAVAIQSAYLTAVHLPDTVIYEGTSYPVTALRPDAFRDCTALAELTLPAGLRVIGASALSGCTALETLTLPAGLESVSEDAFLGCRALSGVYIEDLAAFLRISFADADANPLTVGHSLYLGGTLVSELTVPTSVTELLPYALSGCTSLMRAVIPGHVTRIGHSALLGCTSLSELTVPFVGGAPLTAGITHLGYPFGALTPEENAACVPPSLGRVTVTGGVSVLASAFRGCSSITEVLLPSGLNAIGSTAFLDCSSLTSIAIPRAVGYIGEDAFLGCRALSGVYIEDLAAFLRISFADPDANPLTAGHSLYLDGTLVSELAIPTSVTELLPYALSGCTSLTRVVIPEHVTRIGHSVLLGCTGLARVDIPFVGEAAYNTANTHLGHLFGVGSYEEHASLSLPELRVVAVTGGAEIAPYALCDFPSLTTVMLPASVTLIGDGILSGCSNLCSLTVPFLGHMEGSTESGHLGYFFGADAASGNRFFVPASLETLRILRGTALVPSALSGCVSLKQVELPAALTTIGAEAFLGCSSITALRLGARVSSIGARAFSNCGGLTSILVDSANTVYYSKGNCLIEAATETLIRGTRLSVIPSEGSVTVIDSYAFEGCTGLARIIIPNEVLLIRPYAFLGCTDLESVAFEVAHKWLLSLSDTYVDAFSQYTVDEAQNAERLTGFYGKYYWFQNKLLDKE